jgi:predicted amidophosphoribosyltransferase
MLYILEQMLDALFPPRPSELIVRGLTDIPFTLLPHRRPIHGCTYLASYDTPHVRAAIVENKFHHNRRAARWLAGGLARWKETQTQPLIFVPIPLGQKRARERGGNQVTAVLSALRPPATIAPALVRSRETTPQSSLNRAQRTENVRGAFRCRPQHISALRDHTVVLIDDVVTTGSTMAAARAALAPHLHPSCSLICLALAHAE